MIYDAEEVLKKKAALHDCKALLASRRQASSSISEEILAIYNETIFDRGEATMRMPILHKIDKESSDLPFETCLHSTEARKIYKFYRKCYLSASKNAEGEVNKPSKLWMDIFQPPKADFFADRNRLAAKSTMEWMCNWRDKLSKDDAQPVAKRSRLEYDDDWSDTSLANALLLEGPEGVGKTSLVYAMAKAAGFKVIEINTSEKRGQRELEATMAEALETYSICSSMNATCENDAAEEADIAPVRSGDIRNFFSNSACKKSIKIRKTKHSLILFDDADVIFDGEESFPIVLSNFICTSKVPIVITCNAGAKLASVTSLSNVLRISLERDLVWVQFDHAKLFLMAAGLVCEDENELYKFLTPFFGDWRKLILNLHFLSGGYSTEKMIGKSLCVDSNRLLKEENSNDGQQLTALLEMGPNLQLVNTVENLTLDYLPTIRHIVQVEGNFEKTFANNRRLYYLRKIGLDDRQGSLQKLFSSQVF